MAMRPNNTPPFEHQDLFGGHGTVRVWNLLGRQPAGAFAEVLACELEASGRVGRHVQQQYDEVVIVSAGSGTAYVNQRPVALASGTVVALPLGATLELENTGDAVLSYCIVKCLPREASRDVR